MCMQFRPVGGPQMANMVLIQAESEQNKGHALSLGRSRTCAPRSSWRASWPSSNARAAKLYQRWPSGSVRNYGL